MQKELTLEQIGSFVKNGFFAKSKNLYIINQNSWRGDDKYLVVIEADTTHHVRFLVNAGNEQEAVSAVAGFCSDNDYDGLVFDHYTLADIAEVGESAEDAAENLGLICAGNCGLYIKLVSVTKIDSIH